MTDPATIDPGEELLGRVGVAHALSQSDKAIRVFKKTPDLAKDIDECARRFVRGETGDITFKLPEFDYDTALDQLSKLKEPNHEAFRYLDAHLIGAYQVALARVVKYLAGIVPRETVTTMSTTRNVRPSDVAITNFRRIWAVACDVTEVFRALKTGMLVKDQAVALQVMFPTVFEALKMAILGEIADMNGENKDWALSYSRDQLLQDMLLTSIDDPKAMEQLQKNFADAKAAQGNQGGDQPSPRPSKDSIETPIQRASK
jgi:hypothetical protein